MEYSSNTPPKKSLKMMSGWVIFFLFLGIVLNLICSFYWICMAFTEPDPENGFVSRVASNGGLCSLLTLTAAFGLALILRFKKFGFFVFVLALIIEGIILSWNAIFFGWGEIILFFGIVILFYFLILKIRKNGDSAWSLLEGGGGFRTAKWIYITYLVLFILGVILSIIAANGISYESEELTSEPYTNEDELVVMDSLDLEPATPIVEPEEPAKAKEEPKETDKKREEEAKKKEETKKAAEDRSPKKEEAFDPSEWNEIVREVRKELPIDCGNGIVMNSISFSGRTLTYGFIVDESQIDISVLESQRASMKSGIKQAWNSSEDTKILFQMARKDKVGISAVMRGDRSGKSFSIYYSPSEL